MFRKYYREANDDIKPDEAFVNSVIANAKRRKPPAYSRYTKYAASIAAAAVVVSAAVISMPLWQRVETDNEDIIFDEVISETAPPESTANAALPPTQSSAAATAAPSPKAEVPENTRTSEYSYAGAQKNESMANSKETPPAVTESTEDTVSENAVIEDADDNTELKSEVQDSEDYEATEYNVAAESAAPPVDASEVRRAKTAAVPDSDIPAPEGYYCVGASPYGYTFQNDDGAVIIVTIGYGGEESAPYYSEDGDKIYATSASFGMTVTVNASGADMSTVREIIEAFR